MNEVKFEIVQELGVLSETNSGWKRELNLVSWNGADPKLNDAPLLAGHSTKIG